MIERQPHIEALGDHEFLVRTDDGGVTIRVRADPEIVAQIAGPDGDETAVVAATVAFLTERQDADELPEEMSLDDVVAAYGDFVTDIQARSSGSD
jgi:hypothetical protein